MEEELLYRYLNCRTTEAEEAQVEAWLEASPANHEKLVHMRLQMESILLHADALDDLRRKDRMATGRRHRLWRWSATAAAVLLLFAGSYYFRLAREVLRRSEQLMSVEAPAGQHLKMTLQDGTEVWLNAGTRLEYPAAFTGRERRVRVSGEALFDVKHDAGHPFIVETYACDVEVLGTKFNVVAEPGEGLFSTALFEGQVQVTNRLSAGERVILSPDNMVRLKDGHLAVSRIADRDDYLWTEGIINLTGVSFEELMRRFEKAFGVKIVLERVPDFHIGQGKIRQSVGIDNALRMLQQFARFTYTHDEQNNTIIIR